SGDPFEDFDTLVRTVAVLRGGVPYTTDELVAAYEPVPERAARHAAGEDDWLEVGRLMRRDGCCAPGV
ncbi:hypothetical protein, partial [Streptomyces sp. NPDC058656]|uniref:hypothetical protein n=1 Tax=Streptomyces sp. NPDC058656 TaxID=3346578 RepID=UPI00365AECB1